MKYKFLIFFCLFTIGLRFLADLSPEWTEKYYSDWFFRGVRTVVDHFLSWISIPFWYIFWVLVSIILLYLIYDIFKKSNSQTVRKKLLIRYAVTFTCWLIILFNWLWGFNYARISLEDKLNIQVMELDSMHIVEEFDSAAAALIQAKFALEMQAPGDFRRRIEERTRQYLSDKLIHLGYHPAGKPRVFAIQPNGLLLRLGVLGVYWPFTGEGQVDNSVPEKIKPFIFAHEMSHAYGFTDEGVCNFLAFLACRESGDPAFRYSGELAYFRTIAASYRYQDSVSYAIRRSKLPVAVRKDLDEINDGFKKYPPWLSTTAVYDWYLKAEGIEEGVGNYDRIIALNRAWRQRNKSLQLEN